MWIVCLPKTWPRLNPHMDAYDEHQDALLLWVVRFQAGTFSCAVEACHVKALHTSIPESQPIEALLGLPPAPSGACRRTLLIGQNTPPYALEVSEPVILESLCVQQLRPLPALITRHTQIRALQGLALDESAAPCLLLDLQALTLHDATHDMPPHLNQIKP